MRRQAGPLIKGLLESCSPGDTAAHQLQYIVSVAFTDAYKSWVVTASQRVSTLPLKFGTQGEDKED